MWWTCCPPYFKNSEIWLRGDRSVNLLALFFAVFGPNCMVWAFMILSPPSVIIPPHFTANKATWKKKKNWWVISFIFLSKMQLEEWAKRRQVRGGNCHRDGDLMRKLFFAYILKQSAPFSRYQLLYFFPLKASTASGNSMCHYGLVKAITGKYHRGTWEVGRTRSSSSYLLPTHTAAQVHKELKHVGKYYICTHTHTNMLNGLFQMSHSLFKSWRTLKPHDALAHTNTCGGFLYLRSAGPQRIVIDLCRWAVWGFLRTELGLICGHVYLPTLSPLTRGHLKQIQ